ncbi:TPA: hypothetical protein ACH3X1_000838 [Trebouxia sp. C0004]
MPTDLPITVSYSTSSTPHITTFTFLVNVRLPTVTAFGIRLNGELAAMADRISGIPAGQLSPSGPAYIWNITSTGPQIYIFQVNTTGLTSGKEPNAAPDLSDICAQGVQIADDEGNLLWQQPIPASTCVSWVKQGDNCSYQTIPDNQAPSLSPKLDLLAYYSPTPALYYVPLGAYSGLSSYGGYYTYPPLATPFAPSVTSAIPLFGIQTTPATYSPSPVPHYSPPSTYSLPSSLTTLFGRPAVSPQAAAGSALYARTPATTPYGGAYSFGGYGTAAYGPALSPSPSASPYYGMAATGAYAPATSSPSSRALLSTPAASAPLFGVRQILSSVPFFNRLITPSVMPSVTPFCTLLGQQAEPACVQQSKCSHCFQSKLEDIGLNANVDMVYNEDLNQTSYTIRLASADKMLSTVDSLALKVSHPALSLEVVPVILESDPADPSSEFDLPQQHSSLQSSCDATGLQSSLRWTGIQLDNGQATLSAMFHGKVELFQDDTFLMDGRGQTNLLASASTAVVVVHHIDHCCFQTVPL